MSLCWVKCLTGVLSLMFPGDAGLFHKDGGFSSRQGCMIYCLTLMLTCMFDRVAGLIVSHVLK